LKELSIGFNLLRNLSSLITDNLVDLVSLKASKFLAHFVLRNRFIFEDQKTDQYKDGYAYDPEKTIKNPTLPEKVIMRSV
jgi:hypothetical protein